MRTNSGRRAEDKQLRVVVFGEGKAELLRKIEALFDAEGIVWVPGVRSEDVESIHVTAD